MKALVLIAMLAPTAAFAQGNLGLELMRMKTATSDCPGAKIKIATAGPPERQAMDARRRSYLQEMELNGRAMSKRDRTLVSKVLEDLKGAPAITIVCRTKRAPTTLTFKGPGGEQVLVIRNGRFERR